MHARAVAEHLAKRCMKNLGLVRQHSNEAERLERAGEPFTVVSKVDHLEKTMAVDEPVYLFAINHYVFTKSGARRIAWTAHVLVTAKSKDVIVMGNAPKYVAGCLEATYLDWAEE